MAITAAAVAATTAVAAGAAAYSSSQQAKAAKAGQAGIAGALGVSPWESRFNKQTKDILDEERSVMEDAVAQGNAMSPEIYKLLGYEPIYDTEAPDTGALSNQLRDAQAKVQDAQEKLRSIKQTGKIKNGGPLRPKDKKAMVQSLSKERRVAQKDAAALQEQLSAAQTSGRRIVGIKPLASGPGDPTQSKDDLFRVAFNLENEALARALKGEEPLDATLKTAYDEKERTLRERLRRQLGTDYETSTAGAEALANFDRERAEAFQQYNTEATKVYATLTSQRAVDLSNLTGQRIQQLLSPSLAAAQRATWLGGIAGDRDAWIQSQQNERNLKLSGAKAQAELKMAEAKARGEMVQAIGQGVGALAGGIGAAAGGINWGGGGKLSAASALTESAGSGTSFDGQPVGANASGISDVQNLVKSLNLSAQ